MLEEASFPVGPLTADVVSTACCSLYAVWLKDLQMVLRVAFLICALAWVIAPPMAANDWLTQSRAAVEHGDLQTALAVVTQRLDTAPNDWDALAWHARILGWQKHWETAEREYRSALVHEPQDSDILLGLADVLFFQGKYLSALQVLDRAAKSSAPEVDVLEREARVLNTLGRTSEAQSAYRRLLKIAPGDKEARMALSESSSDRRRFELRVGNESDVFSFADPGNQQLISFRADWSPRWTTVLTATADQRFGSSAQGIGGLVTYKAGKHDWFTFGGQRANQQSVVPLYGEIFGYGHAFQRSGEFFKGVEVAAEERSLWFASSRVELFRATVTTYLPKGWMWTLAGGCANSAFGRNGAEWTPSGLSRVALPLTSRLEANALFAVGSESYATIDQIGQFSARTWGGGLKIRTTALQDVSFLLAYQTRSQSQTQTSVGISYGIRF